ncbi:MAG: hypothetical protein ACI9D1_002154, partial [Cryomorphaceae bacterium]
FPNTKVFHKKNPFNESKGFLELGLTSPGLIALGKSCG